MADALRIMLVDDDPNIAEVLKPLLSDSGYEVVAVVDGESALRVLPRAEPDLFILDVMMPGMDGFELATRIRNSPGHAATPIVNEPLC